MSKYLSNRGYKIIEGVLWVIAIVGMLFLLYEVKVLKGLTKDASNFRSIANQKQNDNKNNDINVDCMDGCKTNR